ncbi:AMP-binding protein [Streptomyces bikiniensis]|uniref:AMP-binding protein n=1 Tax=Streptomyces bikiniensis TaxID=1896 RepID=A0ABW8D2T4_STRBI
MSLVEYLVAAIKGHALDTAVVEGERSFTYQELDRASAEVCGGLLERGIQRDDVICVFATRSWQRCVMVLGVWRAGGSVLSIDPSMPAVRIRRIIETASPALVISDEEAPQLNAGVSQFTWDEIRSEPHENLRVGELGYAIATSGSTGTPKVVSVSAVTLENLARWHVAHWRHSHVADTLHSASVGFDVIYEEMVAAWSTGAKLILVNDQQRRDPFALVDLVRTHAVRRMFSPVGALHGLAMVTEALGAELPTLCEIAVAGERLIINDEVRSFCRKSNVELINQYGPSETHLITQYRLSGDSAGWPDRPPIGSPVVGAELLCFDNGELRPFRKSETAEIVVAGNCVAVGYLGDKALTLQRFRTLLHRDGRMLRCYFTGDRATFDGINFDFRGRLDDQLKINGYRVEPGEVEATVSAIAGVRQVAVIGIQSNGGMALAALYSEEPGTDLDPAYLRAACEAVLPEYMVPSVFTKIDQFPVTANGKTDRRLLAGMLTAGAEKNNK